MSNHLNLCRDGIFGNLQIKGKKIVDEGRNLNNIKKAKLSDLTVRKNAEIYGNATVKGDLIVEGNINSRPDYQAVNLSAGFDLLAAGPGGIRYDITGMNLTLNPGAYLIGYSVAVVTQETYIRVELADQDDIQVAGGITFAGHVVTATNQGVDYDSASTTTYITTETPLTIRLRATRLAAGTLVARIVSRTSGESNFDVPKGDTILWALKLSD